MFTRSKSYTASGDTNLIKFIEHIGNVADIANSTLLYMIDNETTRDSYIITKYENRSDLIARDIYGNEAYSWILLYQNRMTNRDLIRGKVLNYIPCNTLNSIIRSIV